MTPSRRILLLAPLSLAALAALGTAQAWGWGERIVGNGEVASENREVGAFDGVAMSGGFQAVIRQGSGHKLEIKADKNLLPYLETKVVEGSKGRTLEIGYRRGTSISTRVDPSISIEMPSLRAVSLAGSGKVVVEGMKSADLTGSIAGSGDLKFNGLDADKLRLSVSGSGDIVANGRAGMANVSVAGSGDIKAAGLAADEVKVSIAGSGDAAVQALKRLQVSIAGSGDVRYSGSPEISSSIAGSGSIKRLKE